jgi:RNA-binding protein YlmH
VQKFLPWLRQHVLGGLVTIEPVGVVREHPGDVSAKP